MVMPGVRTVVAVTGTPLQPPGCLEPMFWRRDRLLPALHRR
jgi:hypothetical protein